MGVMNSVVNKRVSTIPGVYEEVKVPQRAEEPWHKEGGGTDPFDEPWERLGNAVTLMAVIDYLEAWKAMGTGKYVPYENRVSVIQKEYFEVSHERMKLLGRIHEEIIDKGDKAIDACIQRLRKELGWNKNVKGRE